MWIDQNKQRLGPGPDPEIATWIKSTTQMKITHDACISCSMPNVNWADTIDIALETHDELRFPLWLWSHVDIPFAIITTCARMLSSHCPQYGLWPSADVLSSI